MVIFGISAVFGKPDPLRFADVWSLTQEEIADRLGWAEKTIERDLADVRQNGRSTDMSVADMSVADPLRFADVEGLPLALRFLTDRRAVETPGLKRENPRLGLRVGF